MTIKIRPPAVSAPPATRSNPVDSAPKPDAAEAKQPLGHAQDSAFEPSRANRVSEGVGDLALGRKVRGGVADDSVGVGDFSEGRKVRGGVADDSVGIGDSAEGRKVRGGVADDSVGLGDTAEGRRARGGVADDSVGRSVRGGVADDSVGRYTRGGVADDSVGRKPQGGVADDSVGRKARGGVADDSVGYDIVRAALVGPDTDPNRLALRDAIYDRLENPSYLLDTATGQPVDSNRLRAGLDRVAGGTQVDKLLSMARSSPLIGQRLDAVLTAARGLPVELGRSLVQTLAGDPAGAIGSVVSHIVGSGVFGSLGAGAKQQLADVMAKLDDRGMRLLGAAVQRFPEILSDTDEQGGTVLDHLNQIATQPLNARLYGSTTTEEVLSDALADIVNPNRIDQGEAPTCTVTSMQFELVADEPAEYLRLLSGLSGPQGKVQMRGGGDLRTDAEDAKPEARDGRSITQALFQSAAMEYANGRAMEYDPIVGKSVKTATGEEQRGLKPLQQTTILRQLFGVRYETETLYDEKDGQSALESLRGFDARGQQNRPVLIDIDQGTINHAVTLERVRDGRVYFRDPYGVVRSMPEDLFPKFVVAVHRPADAIG